MALMQSLENIADEILRKGKHLLPTVARLCLVATYIEDGIRMFTQFSEQVDYMTESWGMNAFFGGVFVLYNLVAQLGASGMVLLRFKPLIACILLGSVILFQTFAYSVATEFHYLARSLALAGGVAMLWVESNPDAKISFAGLPETGDNKPKQVLQLVGRVLIVLMFLSLLRFRGGILQWIIDICGLILVLLVAFGIKTKIAAMVLTVMLLLSNFWYNAFWMIASTSYWHDYIKYDFFQTFSVIGGLLLVVLLGPGGYAIEKQKKMW